ncbi:hypothetical protein BDQ17DRAFT_584508 [Cyathus striatus]|nr:hypothetical protein BDQ17DRAFT_584508 [Cyathus striatus]
MFCQDLCESLTWHVFEKPPMRVLDIGCGTGTWILSCARTWKECQFVGLDIVPIQPDLQQAGSPDLASRITWMQANFLDNLPFPNDEFDFVHIKRIALGVPENNWTTLFAEIERVMKPGGAIEIIEEDLFFPGHIADNDDDSNAESDAETTMSHTSSATSNGRYTSQTQENDSISEELEISENESPDTPTKSAISSEFPPVPTHIPPKPEPSVSFLESLDLPDNALVTAPQSPPSVSPKGSPHSSRYTFLIPPHSRSTARPLLQVKTTSSPYPRQISQRLAGSAVSLMSSMGYAPMETPPSDPSNSNHTKKRRRSSSIVTPPTDPPSASTENSFGMFSSDTSSLAPPPITPDSSHNVDGLGLGPRSSSKNSLHMTPEKTPPNPRDHTVIETVYKEMLASRFINSSPISVLGTYLEFYFRDVRTHPPLLYTFPPLPGKRPAGKVNVYQLDYDSDDARDAIIPNTRNTISTQPVTSENSGGRSHQEGTEDQRFLTMEDLVKHTSPYISLDESRGFAFAPKLSAHGRASAEKGAGQDISRLPNTNFHIDLKTLHLHLALRAKEILACSESMWEWVAEHQAQMRSRQAGRHRAGSPPSRATNSILSNSGMEYADISIDDMTRDDFNNLLANFDMDMQDQMALGRALENEFAWSTIVSEPPERKVFDKACQKWDAWAREHTGRRSSDSSHQYQAQSFVSSMEESSSSQKNMSRRSSRDPVGISSSQRRTSTTSKSSLPTSLHSSAYPPTRRLSRAMRVFVGWKAEA